ncbi:hypothetical protein [Neoroseomonas oryzicola]|uniref:N-acetyltransferase domain-containing protein n=1 Tax=Neoroseomonas oryzicola TaxID=535904 RepID=A0A9X9WJZ0_9PROT|nr:hypothetical protein [Neoroseomonas oryzicola]MBR0660650.1 hypothetical protein [Neoroseomonas oryzicola]NKE19992.1 hypothetical protein [Neoroseomonas oryzicola]
MRAEFATPADNAEILRILRENPVGGEIAVSYEREPDFFVASRAASLRSFVVVVRPENSDRIAGLGEISIQRLWLNGVATEVGYLHQLRVDHPYRGSKAVIYAGFSGLAALHGQGLLAETYFSTIVTTNVAARRLLEAKRPGLPVFHHVEDLVTYLMPTSQPVRRPERVRTGGTPAGIAACLARNLSHRQYAMAWSEEDLVDPQICPGLAINDFLTIGTGDNVRACAAVWDQAAFKQTVIRGYGSARGLRAPIGGSGQVVTPPMMPAVGARLRIGFLSHLAVDDDDTRALDALITAACERARDEKGIELLALTLSTRHPSCAWVQGNFRPHTYLSRLYQVAIDGTPPPTPLDPALFAQPEAALL